ncbi:hypothetical protein M0813_21241 [Anaeramoeba flamelloides]|uniref:Uncharacterized protein n=1 Tax=Anaeramoeba flamelloides TaxID=1746091 RepID=A0ABQ8YJ90_9EUKA|nr:hypothetical protein M0813_21241 [Anaeramoeba flamelloides]
MFSNAGAGTFGKFEEESFEEKGKGKKRKKGKCWERVWETKRALVFTSELPGIFCITICPEFVSFIKSFGGSLLSVERQRLITVHLALLTQVLPKVDGKSVTDLPKDQEPDVVAKIIVNAVGKFSQIQTKPWACI